MFWWIFGGTIAVISGPVLFIAIKALVKPDPNFKPSAATVEQKPQPVTVTVRTVQPRRPRHIKVYSNLEQDAETNKERRESIDRRYNRVYPW